MRRIRQTSEGKDLARAEDLHGQRAASTRRTLRRYGECSKTLRHQPTTRPKTCADANRRGSESLMMSERRVERPLPALTNFSRPLEGKPSR